MTTLTTLLILFLQSAPQQNSFPPTDDMGPYLGVLFSRVPEAVLDQVPQLPRDSAVLVTHVLPDSPAASAGLKKHDILLGYDGEKIRDGNHLVRLIQNGKSGQVIRLSLLRGGREMTLEAKLVLGPVLKVAKGEGQTPPGIAKPGGPPAVSVTAVPMDGNRLQITFEYADLGRLRRITCSGNAEEIDREIKKLPSRVQSLAQAAVQQLRKLNLQKDEATPRPR